MIVPVKYDRKLRERAVRLVRDHAENYNSEFEAIKTVAARVGVSVEALRRWVRQAEVDAGEVEGVSSDRLVELRRLRAENAELRQTVEVLKAATDFFVREANPSAKRSTR